MRCIYGTPPCDVASGPSPRNALYAPAVAGDAAGNVMAVWSGSDPDEEVPAVVQAARYNAATGTWSSTIDLAVNEETVLFPVIAGDDRGNVVAAWIRRGARRPWIERDNPNRLQVARYSAATNTWGAAFTIAQADPSGNLQDLAIAGNASGEVVMVWTLVDPTTTQGLRRRTLQSARYSAASGTWRGLST